MTKPNSKFRIWDSLTIRDSLQICLGIKEQIEDAAISGRVHPAQLPNSILPTHTLYDLASTYISMYQKLLDEELIQSMHNPKTNKHIH